MTDCFNFLGLPSVVQELITEEIVHNSIPKDRIQLALTSKYCNELVQRARPKKIIDVFSIQYDLQFTFISNSRTYKKTKEQLMKILPKCQIKQLKLSNQSVLLSGDYSEILGMLSETARFATKFDILYPKFDQIDKIVGFYVKLKHLKSVTLKDPKLILPYYPSKVTLNFGFWDPPEYFLKDLAKKSQNCPLSFFELISRASLEKCQQFLQTAKFSIGAEIFICNFREDLQVYLTYVGQNIFMFEIFSDIFGLIFISQKNVGKNRRIKLKTSCLCADIAFNIISALNPDKNYFSGVFKQDKNRLCWEQTMLINLENVNRDEILKVKFYNRSFLKYIFCPVYSPKMLESTFSTANFTTPEERVEKINNLLGTNLRLIQVENFVRTVQTVRKIQTSWEHVRKINNVLGTNIQLIQADRFVKAVHKIQNI